MIYIASIDGLRAIAVLAIIIFHINPDVLSGGFIGVDIFFIISGFLITHIILSDLKQGQFSFANFYAKRMRRIMPALFFMLAIVTCASYILLIPQDIILFNASLKRVIILLGNYYFANFGSYFAPQSYELPLMHMWSLAVEEQFYFLYPPALFLFYRYLSKKYSLFFITVLIILSFLYAQYTLSINCSSAHHAYFYLSTRCGTILIGALIGFIYTCTSWIQQLSKVQSVLLGILGTILLIAELIYMNENQKYPGLNALLPAFSGICVLCSCLTYHQCFLKTFLSIKLMRIIGQRSYSLYVWHWPILALMRYIHGQKNLPHKWIVLGVLFIFIFSELSYRLIENPIRLKKWSFFRTFSCVYIFPACCLIFSAYAARKFGLERSHYNHYCTSYGGSELCHGKIHSSCRRGDLSKHAKTLVIGDSNAAHFNYFFHEFGQKTHQSFDVVTGSSCVPISGFDATNLAHWAVKPCQSVQLWVENNVHKYQSVIISACWSAHNDAMLSHLLPNYIMKLQKLGIKVTLICQVPMFKNNVQRFIHHKFLGFSPILDFDLRYKQANSKLKKICSTYNVKCIDLEELVLRQQKISKFPYYYDANHINRYAAECIGKEYNKDF